MRLITIPWRNPTDEEEEERRWCTNRFNWIASETGTFGRRLRETWCAQKGHLFGTQMLLERTKCYDVVASNGQFYTHSQ